MSDRIRRCSVTQVQVAAGHTKTDMSQMPAFADIPFAPRPEPSRGYQPKRVPELRPGPNESDFQTTGTGLDPESITDKRGRRHGSRGEIARDRLLSLSPISSFKRVAKNIGQIFCQRNGTLVQ